MYKWPEVILTLFLLFTTVCCLHSHLMMYFGSLYYKGEPSDSVVECLTQDQGVAGSSLAGVTALCP